MSKFSEPGFQPRDIGIHVIDRPPMRWESLLGLLSLQSEYRLHCEFNANEIAVSIFHRVQLIELATTQHQIARERDLNAIDLNDKANHTIRMTLCRKNQKLIVFPGKGFVILQNCIDLYILSE
ncbi:hypothetical protein MPL1032_180057 [Mesorhizobium plurifarium]|uniref:Uncharacterized protein n=1 Tax=Mesorhizobium plurifarium TaxID=69974 RepID=A0A0K2VTI1_MESPL|nr:hypothetical protein MPL1032_180057 [Mesorhizobium plurifarium]